MGKKVTVTYTNHARKKFGDLVKNGLIVVEKDVLQTINDPEHIDEISDAPKVIASRSVDQEHVLRV